MYGWAEEPVVKERKIFCQVAVGSFGYTGALVARFLGMTTSSVDRRARLVEIAEIMLDENRPLLGREPFSLRTPYPPVTEGLLRL